MCGITELICSIKIKLSKLIRNSRCIPNNHGNIKVTGIKLEGNKLSVINHYHDQSNATVLRSKTIMRMCGKANKVEILFQWKIQATAMKALLSL